MTLGKKISNWWDQSGGKWTRRAGYPVVIALAGLFVFAMLRGPQGLLALQKKREDIQRLQAENARQEQDNQKLRNELEQVRNSESERDNVVRRELNLARPGETTFILKPKR
jgi:cell division protein FtsB